MTISDGRRQAVRLLGVSGSLRTHSYSTALLAALHDAMPAGAMLELFSLHEVPIYNQDKDPSYDKTARMQAPPGVVAFKAAILQADGLIVSSPEYNYGIPGMLKNAIDWASRPPSASPLKGKPILIITSSPGFMGGVRAQAQLRDVFFGTMSRVLARKQVVIPSVRHKIVDGRLADAVTLETMLAATADLIAEISSLRATG